MAEEKKWHYEKLGEDGKTQTIYTYTNDFEGKITGKTVINVKAYFDENPEEARRLGWIKHITHSAKELGIEYDPVTQFIVASPKMIDEWTVEDVLHVMDKSEELMAFEDLYSMASWSEDGITFVGDHF